MDEEIRNKPLEDDKKFTKFIHDHLEEIRKTFDNPGTIRLAIIIWDTASKDDAYALTNGSVEEALKQLVYLSRSGSGFSGPNEETIH